MSLLVMKFGGTSVGDVNRIKECGGQGRDGSHKRGHKVAVVVSAMAGVTDQLIRYCRAMSPTSRPPRTGCRLWLDWGTSHRRIDGFGVAATRHECAVVAGLASFVDYRFPAWQGAHRPVGGGRFAAKRSGAGEVAAMAGFQGISPDKRITTLGRGGLGYLGCRAGCRDEGRALRYLHRYRRHLYRRSAHNHQSAENHHRQLRGNAGISRFWVRKSCRCAQSNWRCAGACRCRFCRHSTIRLGSEMPGTLVL